ncbi:response regulator [Mesobacterium pallidum]|uniref:response regulator n=1 Tax=Mesobacterium pallidum TaxID=2872037 RepID=UPI001EE2FFC9|nr:response regulator [Mesobacterium pallidum]
MTPGNLDKLLRDPADGGLANIILVEDDDGDAKAVRRALRNARIANPVQRARNGIEALALLRDRGAPRHYVILLDLKMPLMDGHEFLREVRADPILRRAVVFVLTTSNDDRDLTAAYEHQVAGFVQKRNVGPDFLNLLNTLGWYWRVIDLPDMYLLPGQTPNA